MTRAVCVTSTGSKLLQDFFLDVEDSSDQEMIGAHKNITENSAQGSQGDGVAGLFETIKSLCNEELVKSVNGVFEFHLEGKEPGVWYLDLKNSSGKNRTILQHLDRRIMYYERSLCTSMLRAL